MCSLCIISAISVQEGNKVSSTVQVSKENEGEIQGYPSKKIIPGQSFWDIKLLNDRMHEMTYTWQNQAPVSINRFLTIEYLLKDCLTKEVPRVSFLRTVIMSRGNSCELKPPKNKHSFLALMSRFILVLRGFLNL